MNCPHLKGDRIKQCRAVNCVVVLSGCELKVFCTTGNHRSCPVFLAKREARGEKITLNDYYRIYSRWVRSEPPNGARQLA